MTRSLFAVALLVALSMLVGCVPPPKSGRGFTLPDGDAKAGKQAFVAFQCNSCHKISGVEQRLNDEGEPQMSIALGGEVSRIQTYGELVTSIINPSHKIAKGYEEDQVAAEGKSKMNNYNDILSVSELTDLVAFLQSNYTLKEYEPTDYPMYPY